MNTLEQMTEHGHELVAFHQDPETGLRAIAAVHDTTLGPGFGGCRRWHYATESDALHDVLRLSEGMTWKNAVAGLPVGGGKSVILLPEPRTRATEAEARAMGRFVERLNGQYISAEDVGLTPQFVDWMAEETKHVCGGIERVAGGDPSPHTAQGVVNAMRAALRFSDRGESFEGVHVAIQGAGNVGTNVARILASEGARITIADIHEDSLQLVVENYGATAVSPDEILTVECDVLCPCALGGVIDGKIIPRLNTSILCGGANNILEDYDEDGAALKAAGIVFVPDFVANAGGVIELAGVWCGLSYEARTAKIAAIEQTSLEILKMTAGTSSSYAAAVDLAKKRIRDAARSGAEATAGA